MVKFFYLNDVHFNVVEISTIRKQLSEQYTYIQFGFAGLDIAITVRYGNIELTTDSIDQHVKDTVKHIQKEDEPSYDVTDKVVYIDYYANRNTTIKEREYRETLDNYNKKKEKELINNNNNINGIKTPLLEIKASTIDPAKRYVGFIVKN